MKKCLLVSLLLLAGSTVRAMQQATPQVPWAQVSLVTMPFNEFVARTAAPIPQDTLYRAILAHRLDIVEYIVKRGLVKLDLRDTVGATALYRAVEANFFNAVKCLVQYGADFDMGLYSDPDFTPLHRAAQLGRDAIVYYLVEQGASVTRKDGANNDAYSLAVDNGHFLAADYLKHVQLFLDACESQDLEAIKSALSGMELQRVAGVCTLGLVPVLLGDEKKLAIVKYLIEKGANINALVEYETPLSAAVTSEDFEAVKYLVEKGARVNDENGGGMTPLRLAVERSNVEIARYLREHGADPAKAWEDALEDGNTAIMRCFLECGGNPNKNLALHTAVQHENIDMVKVLVIYGANLNANNQDDQTPLDLAEAAGVAYIIEYLKFASDFKRVCSELLTTKELFGKYPSRMQWIKELMADLCDRKTADRICDEASKIDGMQNNDWFKKDQEKAVIYRQLSELAKTNKQMALWYQFAVESAPQDGSQESSNFRRGLKRKLDSDNTKEAESYLRKKFCGLKSGIRVMFKPVNDAPFTINTFKFTDCKFKFLSKGQ